MINQSLIEKFDKDKLEEKIMDIAGNHLKHM